MEYSPHVALTSGEDNAYALEGSSPVRADKKKELRAAPFLFPQVIVLPLARCHHRFTFESFSESRSK